MADEEQCPCCKIFYGPVQPPHGFGPGGSSRSPLHPRDGLCNVCIHHQGDTLAVKKVRAQHHAGMYRRQYADSRKRVAEAEQAVLEMQRELNMRPVQTVIRIESLDQIIIDEARADRDEAYRRRDLAMGALSDIRRIHHKNRDSKDKCVCGKVYQKCDMAWIADRWEGVLIWEKSQAGRAYRGERHHLEHDHPALQNRDYFRDVYGT